ncbi:MAG: ABC transporter permease, partial [Erysipelotrichaceae bacterium]|nr:ABC transporter permease [Erysipelotrichaceae bacterium]
YDELVLVVQDRTTVSDFMMYNLGYRDPQDLRDYMTKIMNGEKITIYNKPLSLTYEELLQLKYRLVIPADYYRYDEKYQVWENMSDDEDYLKDLIDNGLTLRVVGIVTPKDGVSSTVMQPGIGYLPSLTRYIVEQSGSREVVRQQLQDHEVDVFTNKTFEEANDRDAEKNNLDFDEMFTLDKDKIAKAFGGNVSEKEMQKLISKYVSEAVNSVSTDTSVAKQALNEGFQKIMGKTAGLYIEEKGMDGTAFFTAEDIPGMVEKGMSDKESKQVLSDLEKEYVIPKEMYSQFYSGLISGLLQGYFEQYSAMMGGKAVLNSAMLDTMVKMAMSTDQMADALSNMAAAMSEAKMKSAVGTSMATMSGAIISKMAAAMKVDPDKLAEAFSFNMTEEDLTRLMNTYMNNSNSDITYDGNLRKLGYSDMVTPISIAFYIKDFEAKDTFKQFIEDYNTMMINSDRKENKIIYTDITGILISSVSNIINAISYVLIAFVSISLVVSSIMIGIITYISVLERTKEIGILRSLGASKGNVANVFNAETFIIGLCAGTFGVVLTVLLCYPINHVVRKLTNISSLTAYLPLRTGLILIGISVVLTIIAGLIPSRMAMNCDPVTALRTE